jgi:hypothetical protein
MKSKNLNQPIVKVIDQWEYTDKKTNKKHITSRLMLVAELIFANEPEKFMTCEQISKELQNYIIERLVQSGYYRSDNISRYTKALTSGPDAIGWNYNDERKTLGQQAMLVRDYFANKYVNRLK